jgi:transcriptional regulator with XRE-family HTH domain
MSNKFRIARLNVSLSQEQAAKKLGIHVTTLNKYENDHRQPSADVVRKMADLYSITVDKLLGMKPTTKGEDHMYRQKFEEAQARIIELLDQNAALEKRLLDQVTPRRKKGNGS